MAFYLMFLPLSPRLLSFARHPRVCPPWPSPGSDEAELVPQHRQALSVQPAAGRWARPASTAFTGTPRPTHSPHGNTKDGKGLILLLLSNWWGRHSLAALTLGHITQMAGTRFLSCAQTHRPSCRWSQTPSLTPSQAGPGPPILPHSQAGPTPLRGQGQAGTGEDTHREDRWELSLLSPLPFTSLHLFPPALTPPK